MKNLILASASPRRKMLLEWACLDFKVLPSHADESFPDNMNIATVPEYVALKKARATRATESDLVLAADTIVVIDKQILGKPKDLYEAKQFLQLLSGRVHQVVTGVALKSGDITHSFSDTTEVYFNVLSMSDIDFYVSKFEPLDKAGAYAIQEWIGVVGIKRIEGDFYNVMGLPVNKVLREINLFRSQNHPV